MKKFIITVYSFILLITFILTSTSIYAANVGEYFPKLLLNDGDRCEIEMYSVANYPSGQAPSISTGTSYRWVDGTEDISGVECKKTHRSGEGFFTNPYSTWFMAFIGNEYRSYRDTFNISDGTIRINNYMPYYLMHNMDWQIGSSYSFNYEIEKNWGVTSHESMNVTYTFIGYESVDTIYGYFPNALKWTKTLTNTTTTEGYVQTYWNAINIGEIKSYTEGNNPGEGFSVTYESKTTCTSTSTPPTQVIYYCDGDNDGYNSSSITSICTGTGCEPSGCWTVRGNDCNDYDYFVNPGRIEGPIGNITCNDNKDNDCDGRADSFDTNCIAVSYDPYDTNNDCIIGDFELLNAIDDWASVLLGDFELLDLIDYWASGNYC